MLCSTIYDLPTLFVIGLDNFFRSRYGCYYLGGLIIRVIEEDEICIVVAKFPADLNSYHWIDTFVSSSSTINFN